MQRGRRATGKAIFDGDIQAGAINLGLKNVGYQLMSLRHSAIRIIDSVGNLSTAVYKLAMGLRTKSWTIEGLPVFDYHIYPVACAIADKACAAMQTYTGNRPSSRVRGLVDIVVCLTTETIVGRDLSARLGLEMRLRGLSSLGCFIIPQEWQATSFSKTYTKCAKEASLPKGWQDIEAAEQLAKKCIDPAIAGEAEGMSWNPRELEWKE